MTLKICLVLLSKICYISFLKINYFRYKQKIKLKFNKTTYRVSLVKFIHA